MLSAKGLNVMSQRRFGAPFDAIFIGRTGIGRSLPRAETVGGHAQLGHKKDCKFIRIMAGLLDVAFNFGGAGFTHDHLLHVHVFFGREVKIEQDSGGLR